MATKHTVLRFVGVCLVLAAAIGVHQTVGWARFDGRVNRLGLDLAKPDGLIVTKSLSRLPRDLVRVPLLREILREDFVFYYEHNEDRLSLAGSLRRIAYEHKLQWNDRVVDWVLDEPAEVALWSDAKGAIEHYVIALGRNQLAKVIQNAASIALKDSQLKLAAHMRIDGDRIPVFALNYGRDRTLLIATRGNRAVMLSDPGLLLGAADRTDPKAEAVLAKLLGGNPDAQRLYRDSFGLDASEAEHRIVLSARYLSFGYQHFFPGVEAVRFDFDSVQWRSAVRFAAGQPGDLHVLATARALPARAAACAWMPLSWDLLQRVVKNAAGAVPGMPRFSGTGAVCWYGQSALHMPLFVAELADEPTAAGDKALQAAFEWMVKGEARQEATAREPRIWQRKAAGPDAPAQAEGGAHYLPTLARHKRLVIFSPDDRLVRLALDTLERRYPAIGDTLPARGEGQTLAVFTPKSLAALSRQATLSALPRGELSVLHDAAQTHLMPRLAALERFPAFRVTLPDQGSDAGRWREVRWETLAARP